MTFTYTWCCHVQCDHGCVLLLHTFACLPKQKKEAKRRKKVKVKNVRPCYAAGSTETATLTKVLFSFDQHGAKAALTNGDSDLKKDSDKDEEGDPDQGEAASAKTESENVGENSELVTTAVLADAEDNEDSDVRKSGT